jgi:hypothetical protein
LFELGKRERNIDKQFLPYELECLGQGKATYQKIPLDQEKADMGAHTFNGPETTV